jgi:signal transduction histidine kinase
LLRGGETNDERKEYLETIAAECDRQIDLVLNLLDLSRIEAGKFSVTCTEVDVAGIVRNCAAMERHAAQARSHNIAVDLPDNKMPALADASALRRILCGLIENAIKYTPDGGRITLSAHFRDHEVAVSVSDNGCGISAADLPHIFEKFYQGHPSSSFVDSSNGDALPQAPGVGLGLYLARTLVNQFGGRITVEAADGNGSTFTIYLPTVENHSGANEDLRNVEAVAHS